MCKKTMLLKTHTIRFKTQIKKGVITPVLNEKEQK